MQAMCLLVKRLSVLHLFNKLAVGIRFFFKLLHLDTAIAVYSAAIVCGTVSVFYVVKHFLTHLVRQIKLVWF